MRRRTSFFLISATIILIDQLTKQWAHLNGWVQFNSGISFSFLEGISVVWISALAVFVMLMFMFFFRQAMSIVPAQVGLVIGGGISNLLDRVQYGAVRDWLPIPGMNVSNNLADWFILIGLLSLIVKELRHECT